MHTILLATVLGGKLQLGHLTKHLEVLGPGELSLLVLDRLEVVTEHGPVGMTVAVLEVVARSLVDMLRSPEGTVGHIDVHSETGTRSTNGCLWLIES